MMDNTCIFLGYMFYPPFIKDTGFLKAQDLFFFVFVFDFVNSDFSSLAFAKWLTISVYAYVLYFFGG